MLHVILQTAVSCDIDIFRCLHFHMSGHNHPTSSEAVSQWSGGNPGFLGPAGRMPILTWIHTHTQTHTHTHTHTHTDDICLFRVGIVGVIILRVVGLRSNSLVEHRA